MYQNDDWSKLELLPFSSWGCMKSKLDKLKTRKMLIRCLFDYFKNDWGISNFLHLNRFFLYKKNNFEKKIKLRYLKIPMYSQPLSQSFWQGEIELKKLSTHIKRFEWKYGLLYLRTVYTNFYFCLACFSRLSQIYVIVD